jgi:putative salt-induced outer membrane protein
MTRSTPTSSQQCWRPLSNASALLVCAALGQVHAQPAPPDGQWRGSLGLSGSLSAGNTESASFSAKLDATRATEDNKWSLYGTSLYGKRRVATGDEKTADNARLGVRHDNDFAPPLFGFVLGEAETDRLADLDYRTTIALGLGVHVVKSEAHGFDVFAGLARTHSKYDPDFAVPPASGRTTELLLGEESSHKLSETLSLKQKLTVYPSLESSGEFRSVFDASLIVGLTSRLSLQVGLQNKYTSEVPLGVKKSDTLLLTGLNVRFGAP